MNKRWIKTTLLSLLVLPGLILLYLTFAVLFSVIPVNTSFQEAENGIDIFIKSNGVHTDLVLPAQNGITDWTTKLAAEDFQPSDIRYIAFGWGDKGFYLDTPTWGDLKFSTAFNAMFWLGTSAMHVTALKEAPAVNERVRKITISEHQYRDLTAHIEASFQTDENGRYELIPGHHYKGVNDNFYEGIGTYNLFTTCNCWTNGGLKKAGIRTALWAPFEQSVMWHLE